MINYGKDQEGMSFEQICQIEIEEWLDDNEGSIHYACDLDTLVVESDNIDGAFVLGRESAMEFIRDYYEDARDTFQDWKDNTGESINPFENPEEFTVLMESYGVRKLLNESEFIRDNWDEEVVLTPDVINQIKSELNQALDKEPDFGGR